MSNNSKRNKLVIVKPKKKVKLKIKRKITKKNNLNPVFNKTSKVLVSQTPSKLDEANILPSRLTPSSNVVPRNVGPINIGSENVASKNVASENKDLSKILKKTKKKHNSSKMNSIHLDCSLEQKIYDDSRNKTLKNKHLLDECKKKKYKYGNENLTLYELLKLIKTENKEEVIDFIELFPFTGIKGYSTATQSHVFEALWNLIFIFQTDNLLGTNNKREFYKKLESMEKETNNIELILKTGKVHESKKSGIADTFFEQTPILENKCEKCGEILKEGETLKSHQENCKIVLCSLKEGMVKTKKNIPVSIPSCNSNKILESKTNNFIFSAKYFKKEKSISNYDIQNIFIEAQDKLSKFNIILLVKNKEDLDKKADRTTKVIKSRFNKIMDMKDLDSFYKKLLNSIFKKDIDLFITEFGKSKDSNVLLPRFHQQYFINYSIENIVKNNLKIVWGAVPRSGKSYMIGGLISQLQLYRPVRNVVIILGAVSETVGQFYQMFNEYSDFDEYKKYNIQSTSDKYDRINEKTDRNIILISQQQTWCDIRTGTIPKKLEEIFKMEDTIVFFDEIHQGSSSKSQAQMEVLNKYIFNPKIIFPFIMVTATFAKPLKRYLNLGGQKSKLIQWRYEDIQAMKDIEKDNVYEKLIEEIKLNEDSLDEIKKSKILEDLFELYIKRGISRIHLAKEYQKYPELVILSPNLENNSFINEITQEGIKVNEESGIIQKFDLERDVICSIFKSTSQEFSSPEKVISLLKYIRTEIYDNFLKRRLKFDVFGRKHTQLWFLPTACSNYNPNPKIKKLEKEKEIEKTKKNIIAVKRLEEDIQKEKDKINNVTIEKMTRFLSRQLLNNDEFRQNFCILVIHSQDLKSKEKMNMKPFVQFNEGGHIPNYKDLTVTTYTNLESKDLPCVSTKCVGDNKLGTCIEKEEACAHAQGKSLIILTGMRLRLGISLPCVDIALHMDPITSVDTIYQSMFRVLTEREGKNKGYFIDLLSERFVNFIYEYDDYTNKSNKSLDIEFRKKSLIEKLFSFNLNGLNSPEMVKNESFGTIYKKISENLDLNNDINFNKRTNKLEESNITNMLSNLEDSNIELFNKFYSNIKALNIDFKKISLEKLQALKLQIYKRQKLNKKGLIENDNSLNKFIEDDKPESKKETSKSKCEKMTNYIKDIFTLVNLFEEEIFGEKDTKCNPIELKTKFIENLKYDLVLEDINEHLCEKDQLIIDCHISYIKNIKLDSSSIEDKEKILIIINLFRQSLIFLIESLNDDDIIDLFKFYCSIRDSFSYMSKNMDKQDMIIKTKCTMKGGGQKTKQSSTQLIENETVLETIRKYLSVRDEEKKLFGEVFTPVELVCEMLDKLPQEVWSNPNLKWLDPANGIGNYPVVAYYKLMEGLKDVKGYENKDARSKHIIENMLFMVELNPVNCKVCRKIFKLIDSNSIPNIYNSPFYTDKESKLTETWKSKYPIKTFDVIMGNPPYNQGGIRSKKGTSGGKTKTIWPIFIEESIKLLNKDKYLLFITPSSWTEMNTGHNNISGKMLNLQLEYLKCYKVFEAHKMFGDESAEIPLSYYLLRRSNTKLDTKIWDDNHKDYIKFNIYDNNFVPNFNVSIISKILKKTIKKYNFEKSTGISGKFYEKFSIENKYPILHYANHKLILKFSKICGKLNKKKILLPNSSMGYPIIDKYGIINCEKSDSYNIIDENTEDLIKLQQFLLSNISFLLINSLKTRQKFLSNRIFQILPDVSKLDFEINDENLIEYFGLDEKDIEAIERQRTSGDGKLTYSQKKEIMDFDIKKYMTKEQIKTVKESIETECKENNFKRTKKAKKSKTSNDPGNLPDNVPPKLQDNSPNNVPPKLQDYSPNDAVPKKLSVKKSNNSLKKTITKSVKLNKPENQTKKKRGKRCSRGTKSPINDKCDLGYELVYDERAEKNCCRKID